MAYTTVDLDEPLVLLAGLPSIDEAIEAALAEAQSVLDRHSRFTTNPKDKGFCAGCVQNNHCAELTRANALMLSFGLMPRRRSRSRTVGAMREAKRREDAWLAE